MKSNSGFTLVETMFGMALFAVSTVSLLTGITFGFTAIQSFRETQTVTQELVDKTELVRYRTWNGLQHLPYDYVEVRNGLRLTGRIESEPIEWVGDPPSYADKVVLVRVTVKWKRGNFGQELARSWETWVAESGYGTGYDAEQ